MTATKKQPSSPGKGTKSSSSKGNKNAVPNDEDVRQESSKAADAASKAQKRAKELKEAAAGAGDPEERQKLMEEAIDAQIEAESFGKTAKYLRSGAFQGLAAGTGLGVAPGATLGAVTGTLVGGVSSTILGGLGGGIGTAAGAIHGPIWNLGEVAGKGVRKFTGDLPGWAASKEQKQALEKMMGQIQDEDMPDEDELQRLHEEGGAAEADEGWMKSVKDMMPSMANAKESTASVVGVGDSQKDAKTSEDQEEQEASSKSSEGHTRERKKPRKLETKSRDEQDSNAESRKQPRKLETRSGSSQAEGAPAESKKGQPRKLEARS